MSKVGATIPLFPLGSPLFPGMVLPLHIFEDRYRALVRDLLAAADSATPAVFGVVSLRSGHEVGDTAMVDLADVGCLADVRAVGAMPDGHFELVTLGLYRFHLDRVITGVTPYLQADVSWIGEEDGDDPAGLAASVRAAFDAYRVALASASGRAPTANSLPDSPTLLSYAVGAAMVLPRDERQQVLATQDTGSRLRLLLGLLAREQAILTALRAVPAWDIARTAVSAN